MSEPLRNLAQRIKDELNELGQVTERIQTAWEKAQQSADDLYVDSVALNLHGFYSGLERIFERIATNIDGSLPQGANWHQLLLSQMESEVGGVRPAVISSDTHQALDEYRGFRHIVRNLYTFRFDPARIQLLVEAVPSTFAKVGSELLAFVTFLEASAQQTEEE